MSLQKYVLSKFPWNHGPCAALWMLGVELTSAHTKPTKNKEFLNQNFALKIERFECCECILHKHLKSSICPYNLVVGGLRTSIFVLTGVCKWCYNYSKLYRKKRVNFPGLGTENPFLFSAILAAVKGLLRGSCIFLSTLLLWLFPRHWQQPQYFLIMW